jgi:uncharacterized protein YjcR
LELFRIGIQIKLFSLNCSMVEFLRLNLIEKSNFNLILKTSCPKKILFKKIVIEILAFSELMAEVFSKWDTNTKCDKSTQHSSGTHTLCTQNSTNATQEKKYRILRRFKCKIIPLTHYALARIQHWSRVYHYAIELFKFWYRLHILCFFKSARPWN